MKQNLKHRMYGFVMYQLGGTIHAGIQFGHSKDEFEIKYSKTKEYKRWLHYDKVYVILNGGTTNSQFGSMQENVKMLEKFHVKFATFREEDMDNIMTAISFLVDERVFDKKKYPSVTDLQIPGNEYGDDKDCFFLEKQAKVLEKNGIFEFRDWLSKFPLAK